MKTSIKDIRIYSAVSTLSKPIADATHDISKISFYVLEVELESGVTGQGYLLSFHYSPNAIEGALKDVRNFVLNGGYQVHETVRVKQDWDKEAEYFGINGVQNCAIAALNIAMWDAKGKTLGQPIWKLFGSNMKKIPVYGSGGWISYSDQELLDEVLDYQKRGFTAVKVKVGHPDGIERDIARLRMCREKLGDKTKIMMDANQGMDVPTALALAKQAREIGLQWFEEPIGKDNHAGYQLLRNQCGIAIACGEREYDCQSLKELIKRNAIDMWQPDLVRMGGVETWRDSIALANAYDIPALPHYYKDYDVPLLCTVPKVYGAESFDWINAIIDNTMRIENGYAYPRETPGWGFSFKEEYLTPVK